MAEHRIQLDIVTPDKLAFSGEVDEVNLPGSLGEFGVLPGHTPFLSELKIGPMHFRREGQVEWYALNRGIAEVTPQKVTVLVKTAEAKAEIDARRAEAARARAEQRLKEKQEGIDVARAQAALQRAIARLKVAGV
ncbi:MAG: F0F1 ATP synthase subunit epsilon [Thermodesulfobacteriota bacterium]